MLQPGDTVLSKYRIEALVGQGAFAHVYRATHLALNAPRALKILRRDAPGLGSTEFADHRARFELEARLGAELDHPHVIRVFDFEQDGETLILVMEYAAGGSLADRLAAARQGGGRWTTSCETPSRRVCSMWPAGISTCTTTASRPSCSGRPTA